MIEAKNNDSDRILVGTSGYAYSEWVDAGFYPAGYWDRFAQMAEEFQLAPKAKIKSLSKGMRAKVSLALAMAHEPELLILDEPALGLDPVARRALVESMIYVTRNQDRTILFSSHLLSDVEAVCQEILVLRKGKLLAHQRVNPDDASDRPTFEVEGFGVVSADRPVAPGWFSVRVWRNR